MSKHYVIIGGSSGLGKVVALKLLMQNNKVTVISRNDPKILPNNGEIQHIPLDFLKIDELDLKKAVEKITQFGNIDYMIFAQRYRGDQRSFANEMRVTIEAPIKLIDAAVNYFRMDYDAAIVFLSSVYGKYTGSSQPVEYHVAKAGVDALVKYYSVSLGRSGVRVNGVSPLTYLKHESASYYKKNNLLQKYVKSVPLKRMGMVDEIADVVLFLASNKSTYVNGQNIIIDGGLSSIWAEEFI